LTKKILILGGGTGGVVASTFLAEEAEHYGLDIEVTVVDKSEWHYMPPLWMDVAVEGMPLEETRAPLRGLEKYGVNVVVDEAKNIVPEERKVELASGKSLDYDYLIIALGSRNGWNEYPGLAEVGYHNYSPEGAVEFHKALASFRGGKIVIAVPEVPFRCGIYPMEFSTVLAYKLANAGIKPDITIVAPEMPGGVSLVDALGPDIARLWRKYFRKYGIRLKTHKGFEKVDLATNTVVTRDFEEKFDLLVKVPPIRLPRILENDTFMFPQDKRFTKVRPRDFRHPEYDDIFLPGEHAMPPAGLATAGVFIHSAAYRVGAEIIGEIGGVYMPQEYPPVACVAYIADKGFLGVCETKYHPEEDRYTWNDKCYNALESALVRKIKRAFYTGWLDKLR